MSPTRTATNDDLLVFAWRGLLDQHARAHCALERALKGHDLGVSEYEVLERTEDRRGIYVRITDAGRTRYKAARPAHRAALAEALGDLSSSS